VILLVLIPYGLRIWLLQTRQFDQDEFEHLHVAWLVSKGSLPYLDFFEHHTPWFHFFLAPFYGFFDVERNSRDAVAFLFLARTLMWLLTGIILLLTFWLGKLWRDNLVGFVAILFLINTEIFSATTLEVRPDLFACIFWLACLVMAVKAVRLDTTGPKIWLRFAWSGFFLGAGIMSTPKVFFVLPGLAVAMALYVLIPVEEGGWLARFRNGCFLIAGACLPLLLTLGYFYLKNGLREFVYYNLLFNFRFKDRFSPFPGLHQLIFSSPYMVFFGLLALLQHVPEIIKRKLSSRADLILVPSTFGVIAGVFIVPVPHAQYYLLLLPLLALFGAIGVVKTIETLWELRQQANSRKWIVSASYYVLGALVFLGLVSLGAGSPHPYIVVAFWFCALAGGIIFLWLRVRLAALIFFLVMVSVPPLKRLIDVFNWRNTDQINQIRYVIENTAPTDTFMDGFTGTGLFRPHAYFFFCFTAGIQKMLTANDFSELLANLQSGKMKPEYLIFDKNLRRLPAAITSFFSEHYQPVGQGDIWQRRKITAIGQNKAGEAAS